MNQIEPPFQEPLFDQYGQISAAWRIYFDNVAKAINKLNELLP